ncbi:MAG: BatD family protein [Acidobacteriota bacterium]
MKKLALAPILLVAATAARAEVEVTAEVDATTIGTEDQLVYTISVTRSGGENRAIQLSQPDFAGFRASGPSSSTQTQMSIGGGVTRASTTTSYTWILTPAKEGTITIGAATITTGGEVFRTTSKAITVVQGSVRPGRSSGPRPGRVPSPFDDPFFRDPFDEIERLQQQEAEQATVLVEAKVDKTTAYAGEGVTLTYTLTTNVSIANVGPDVPSLEGFRVEEVKLPDRPVEQRREINGRVFSTAVMKQFVLYPLASGTLSIPESTWTLQVVGTGFWGMPRQIQRKTKPITIQAMPIPAEGKPDGWSGAVGSFDLKATVDKTKVATGDAVTLSVVLSGVGDLRGVTRLPLVTPADVKVYEPKMTESVDLKGGKPRSQKTLEYVIVPNAAGVQKIAGIRLPFFDPALKAFRVAEGPAFEIEVTRAVGSEAEDTGPLPRPVAPQPITSIVQDIRYLHPAPAGNLGAPVPAWRHTGVLALLFAPLVVNGILLGVRWKRSADEKQVGAVRARRALSHARRVLKEAARALRGGDEKEFHSQVSEALCTYVADRFDVPRAGLTSFRIESLLDEGGCPTALRDEVKALLHECDFARFTPAKAQEDEMKARRDRALRLVRDVDASLPRRSRPRAPVAALLFAAAAGMVAAPARAAEDPRAAWQRATTAYQERRYDESARAFQALVDQGVDVAAVHYDLGNAELRAGHVGRAIASYQRALKRQPGDTDTLANLAFASERVTDDAGRTVRPQDVARRVIGTFGASQAAWLAVALWTLAHLALALRLAGARMGGLVPAAAALFGLALLCGGYGAGAAAYERSHVVGVVLDPKVEVRSGPAQENAVLFVVHEGLSLTVRDRQGPWALVTLGNDLTGWLPVSALAII